MLRGNWLGWSALPLVLALSGCGGEDAGSVGPPVTLPPSPAPAAALPVEATLEFAQSHVIPAQGRTWTFARTGATNLHLVGRKPALALVQITRGDSGSPRLEARRDGALVGSVALAAPAALPGSDQGAGSPTFATNLWSADVPGEWLVPGVSFTVTSTGFTPSAATSPLIGADSPMTVRLMPFYLFGASPANSIPLSESTQMPVNRQAEMLAKLPVATLDVGPHPAGAIQLDRIVISPRNDSAGAAQPAYVLTNRAGQRDGFAAMSATLSMMEAMRRANGEGSSAALYYSPIITLGSDGRYASIGGGLGSLGGGVSNGDTAWGGVFIHELGHNFILSHANDAFAANNFPYAGGSLAGSAWGYDAGRRQFISPFLAASTACGASRQVSATGRCFKQDPMQGGAGDQSAGYAFTMFADANAALIQRSFEGVTTAGSPNSQTGPLFQEGVGRWSRWDSILGARVPFTPTTTNFGRNGFNDGLPATYDVPVHSIVFTINYAGVAGATHIYPAISHRGNLLRLFDPTDANDRALIAPGTGTYRNYCFDSGCDYSVRVTYADGSTVTRVVKGAFRPFGSPTGTVAVTRSDPLNGDSMRTYAINVPGDRAVQRIELLSTPLVWQGLPGSPTVVASL